MANRKQPDGGRPKNQDVLDHRSAALKEVIKRYRENRERGCVSAEEIAKVAGITDGAAKDLISELDALFGAVRASRDRKVLEWGGTTHYEQNVGHHSKLKEAIARRFVDLLPSTTSIACSAGTTVTYCIRMLNELGKPAHIVTNNLGIVRAWRGVEEGLDLTGGTFDPETNALTGESVVQSFESLRCSNGLIGVSGVSPDGGGRLFVKHRWEAKYRAAIVRTVSTLYICCDAEKLAVRDLWQFATVEELADLYPNLHIVMITNPPNELPVGKQREDAIKTVESLEQIAEKLGGKRFKLDQVRTKSPPANT